MYFNDFSAFLIHGTSLLNFNREVVKPLEMLVYRLARMNFLYINALMTILGHAVLWFAICIVNSLIQFVFVVTVNRTNKIDNADIMNKIVLTMKIIE